MCERSELRNWIAYWVRTKRAVNLQISGPLPIHQRADFFFLFYDLFRYHHHPTRLHLCTLLARYTTAKTMITLRLKPVCLIYSFYIYFTDVYLQLNMLFLGTSTLWRRHARQATGRVARMGSHLCEWRMTGKEPKQHGACRLGNRYVFFVVFLKKYLTKFFIYFRYYEYTIRYNKWRAEGGRDGDERQRDRSPGMLLFFFFYV